MTSILFFLTFSLTVLFFVALAKLVKINLFSPSIITIFFWMYLVFAYLGIFGLYFGLDEYRFILGVNDRLRIIQLWVYSSIALLSIIIGFIFSNKLLRMNLNSNNFKKEQLTLTKSTKFVLLILFSVSIIVFLIYLSKLPSIPIVSLLLGTSEGSLKALRSAATNAFPGGYHWYSLFFNSIFCLLCYVTFAELLKKYNKINIFIFASVFAFTAFAAIVPTHKAPIIWIFIGLLITYMIVRNKRFSFKTIMIFTVIAIPSLTFMYKFFMGYEDRTLFEIFNSIISRTFTGQITPAYFYLEIFPEKVDFLLGRSLPNPMGILPWEHYQINVEVMNYMNPHLVGSDIVGSAPTVYWAEAYANFGFLGIIVTSIIIGVILYSVQYIVLSLPKSSLTIGLNTWLMLELQKLSITGISNFMLNIDLFVICIIGFFLIIFENNIAKNKYKAKVVSPLTNLNG
ncbi:O-antigen polymerase [Oceanobacillus profundus]|uniref:Oligosaccharide repeat unit polymerase n=1 Tax=Oceanobacillus profundus TaxID=372463 RepID=A0A417YCP6_9BACI|nr:O-antigen polymerase [Oceanobacillus profundus]RHW30393.1 oligosaccharide repeat unit polymerase [Oceanobacillus profundus]